MITDTNVSLSRWPFRRLVDDEPARLVASLRKRNVTEAWAGSFDALLHKDIAGVNARLARDCAEFGKGLLVPFGTVNLRLPDWKDDLRRCQEVHGMPGIRLHPDYHGYKLTDSAFTELLALAVERRLIVQIAVTVDDQRTQHPLVRVAEVDLIPLAKVLKPHPRARVQLLNLRRAPATLVKPLMATAEVYFDFSSIEGVWGLTRLCQSAPSRVVFGSHSPYLYFESVYLKIQEAGSTVEQVTSLLSGNAARLRDPGVKA